MEETINLQEQEWRLYLQKQAIKHPGLINYINEDKEVVSQYILDNQLDVMDLYKYTKWWKMEHLF